MQPALSHDAVEPAIRQHHRLPVDNRRQILAPRFAAHAADLEDVGKVGGEVQAHRGFDGLQTVVANLQLLITDAIPEKTRQRDFERSQRKPHQAFVEKVGIGERDAELIVFVAHRRAEEERAAAFQVEQEAREKSCAVVIEAFFTEAAGLDVAVVIEDAERVAVLEHARSFVGETRRRQDAERAAVGRGDRDCFSRSRAAVGCAALGRLFLGSGH